MSRKATGAAWLTSAAALGAQMTCTERHQCVIKDARGVKLMEDGWSRKIITEEVSGMPANKNATTYSFEKDKWICLPSREHWRTNKDQAIEKSGTQMDQRNATWRKCTGGGNVRELLSF